MNGGNDKLVQDSSWNSWKKNTVVNGRVILYRFHSNGDCEYYMIYNTGLFEMISGF